MAVPQNYVSVSRRPPDVEDYIDMLRRYRSWVIGPTFAGLVISVVVAFFWPNMYVCSAAMEIRPSKVSSELMPSSVVGQMQQRLEQLRIEILDRDNLILLIKDPKLDLYPKERQRYSVEDVVEQSFAKHIHIVPYEAGSANRVGAQAFKIIFEYSDRAKALAVVQEVISEFESKSSSLQAEDATSQSSLFDDLVKNAKDRMEKAEKELADFTAQNQGKLPENFSANYADVQYKTQEQRSVQDKIANARVQQTQLEGNLAANKREQAIEADNLNVVFNQPNQVVKDQNLINIQGDINRQKLACTDLEKTYQQDWPDVQACHAKVKELEDEQVRIEQAQPPAAAGATTITKQNQAVAQRLNELRNLEQDIEGKISSLALEINNWQSQDKALAAEVSAAEEKIQASSQITSQYKALDGEFQMAKENYENQVKKQNDAGTAQSVEEHHAGETLDVLENAILPETPTSPVRPAWVAIGTLLGLVLGIALAGAKEVKNTSLKNLKDVRAYTNLPILSSVPLLENALLVRRKRRLAWLAWSSAIVIGSILMSGAMYYYYFLSNQVTS